MKTERVICTVVLSLMLVSGFGCNESAIYNQQYIQQRNQQRKRVVSVPPGVAFNALPGVNYVMEKTPATIDLSKFYGALKNGVVLLDPDEMNTLISGRVYVFVPGLKKESTEGKKIVFVGKGETKNIDHNSVYVVDVGGSARVPPDGETLNLLISKDETGRTTITECPKKIINYQPPSMEIEGVQIITPPPQTKQ